MIPKFRAIPIVKPVDSGEFVYGGHVFLEEKHYIIPDTASITYGVKIITEHDFIEGFIEVHPDTVGMSTGLKERYGKKREIWQGDEVRWRPSDYHWAEYCDDLDEEVAGVIVWYEPAGRWAIEVNGTTYWPTDEEFFACEIIGNIHEDKQ